MIIAFHNSFSSTPINVSLWSFLIIAVGGVGSVLGGYLSVNKGVKEVAFCALLISGVCCLISPLILSYASTPAFIAFLMLWGITIIPDSPLFSTLVASYAEPKTKGTALTIVNCVGFSLTIVSIQLIQYLSISIPFYLVFLFLFPGPLFGLISVLKK